MSMARGGGSDKVYRDIVKRGYHTFYNREIAREGCTAIYRATYRVVDFPCASVVECEERERASSRLTLNVTIITHAPPHAHSGPLQKRDAVFLELWTYLEKAESAPGAGSVFIHCTHSVPDYCPFARATILPRDGFQRMTLWYNGQSRERTAGGTPNAKMARNSRRPALHVPVGALLPARFGQGTWRPRPRCQGTPSSAFTSTAILEVMFCTTGQLG